jgi:hypothetical protein
VDDFLGASVEQISRTVLSSRSGPLWLDTNILAALGTYKSELEKAVGQLSAEKSKLHTAVERLLSGPDLNVFIPAVVLAELLQLPSEGDLPNRSELENQFLQATDDPSFDSDRPRAMRRPNPSYFGAETAGMRVVSGCCKQCGWGSGLLEERGPLGWLVGLSLWCPVCGVASVDARFQAYFLSAVAEPLVFLAQFVLAEAFLRSEDLLRLILAAVSVLLSRLRAAAFPRQIATSQRSFFIHHGAHPPRARSLAESGLLGGRVFQLQPAA